MINILYSRVGAQLTDRQFSICLQELPSRIRNGVLDLTNWRDAQASLFGKVLLKTGLLRHHRLKPDVLDGLQFTVYNRPFLPSIDIDFNISHSGDYVICVIADKANVGIDVERIRPVQIEDFAMGLSDDELIDIKTSTDPSWTFFNYWAKKEAVTKAEGKGLNLPMSQIMLNNAEDEANVMHHKWFLYEIALDSQHCSWFALNHRIRNEQITMEFLPFR